ncbi:ABC transporter substrate-binding protein [Occallatibacter savannae]|uniref:ABC transporter substrate-binding protein n=1 Tax=Occallatibacter savannae TaxID=1002691 RepID=UPI000D691D97|nr:ABC transporter substrate-binding protein [Occallatibacter savannae]
MRRKGLFLICALVASALSAGAYAQSEMRFCLSSQPKTFNPLAVDDDASETIRYLTGGVLIRLDRNTQQPVGELATAWRINKAGDAISFTLRPNVRFSDGTPFSATDVAFTVERLMDPDLHSPTGDSFRSTPGKVATKITDPYHLTITFPGPVIGLDRLFDQVAIISAQSPQKYMAVLGPYYVADNKAGSTLLLKRNPNYWKHDSAGRQLPYIDSIRLDIQQNRDRELLRLTRGEIDLVNSLNAESFDLLKGQAPSMAFDAGVSLDSEQIWFNQVPTSPLPDYKKAWFTSTHFRRAVSSAIHRDDIARLVFHGYAQPAVSLISPANKIWFNQKLKPHAYDVKLALRELELDGFRLQGDTLRDRTGHAVEFSVITNAGNKDRERMASVIQQDLRAIGIRLNIVTLDFPSLIERITRSFNYESCLLGFVNDELDPNAQMSVWLSSADNHQWNPNQKQPATAWETEIDRLMREQASSLDPAKRKRDIDRVQQLVWEQEPFIYLVNKHALSAVSPNLRNAHPVGLRPQVYWNIEQLAFATQPRRPQ